MSVILPQKETNNLNYFAEFKSNSQPRLGEDLVKDHCKPTLLSSMQSGSNNKILANQAPENHFLQKDLKIRAKEFNIS